MHRKMCMCTYTESLEYCQGPTGAADGLLQSQVASLTCSGRQEWGVNCDEITPWPDLFQRQLFHIEASRLLRSDDGVVAYGLKTQQRGGWVEEDSPFL